MNHLKILSRAKSSQEPEVQYTTAEVVEKSIMAKSHEARLLGHVSLARTELHNAKLEYGVRNEKKVEKNLKSAKKNVQSHREATNLDFGPTGRLTPQLIDAALVEDNAWEENRASYEKSEQESETLVTEISSIASQTIELPVDANNFARISSLFNSLEQIERETDAPYIQNEDGKMVVYGQSIGFWKPFTSTYKMDPERFTIIPTKIVVELEDAGEAKLSMFKEASDTNKKDTSLLNKWYVNALERARTYAPAGMLPQKSVSLLSYNSAKNSNDTQEFEEQPFLEILVKSNGDIFGSSKNTDKTRVQTEKLLRNVSSSALFGYFEFDK